MPHYYKYWNPLASNNTWTTTGVTSSGTWVNYPAVISVPEARELLDPKSPLDWLRSQVAEVCDLAYAA